MSYYDALNNAFGRQYSAPTYTPRTEIDRSLGDPNPLKTRFQQRGFPEAIQAEDYVPEQAAGEIGGIPGAIDTAFRGPAYVAERPLSLIDQVARGAGAENGVIDPVVEGIRGIPVVGDPLSGLGDLTEDAFDFTYSEGNLIAQPMNAHLAMLWDSTKDNEEHEPIGSFDEIMAVLRGKADIAALLPFDETITKAKLREGFNNHGWSNEDLNDIETGRKGWLDMHDKSLVSGLPGTNSDIGRGVEDFVFRAAGDPLNIMMGSGAIAKTGQVFRAGKVVTAGLARGKPLSKSLRAVRINNVARKMAPSIQGKRAKNIDEGVAAIEGGSVMGVSKASVAKYIRSRIASPITGYRDLAVASTGIQVGINSLDQVVNGDGHEPADGFMGDVFNFARKWGGNKPLSKNDMFTLYSIMKVPGRTMAAAAVKPVSKRRNARRKFHHENEFVEILHPELVTVSKGKGKDYSAARAEVVRRLGGETMFEAAMSHILRADLHNKNFLEGVPSLPNLLHVTTLAEAGKVVQRYSEIMNGMVTEALEKGTLRQRDLRAAVESFSATRGGVLDDATRGVTEQNFRAEDFYTTWGAWERLASKTAAAFKDGVAVRPGITADLITTDGIDWLLANLDVLQKGKTITGEELMKLLRSEPAVFNFPGGSDMAKALTRDGAKGTHEVADIRKMLNEIRSDHAISRAEYVASWEAWENVSKANESAALFASEHLAAGGKLADDVSPDMPNAATAVMPATDGATIISAQAEVGGAGMGVIRHIRNSTSGQGFRYNVVAGLKLAGYGVRSSVDSVALIGGRGGRHGMATPALLVRLNPMTPVSEVMDVLAHGLSRSKAKRATAVWRGKNEINALGLTENATELTYKVGNKTESEWNTLINKLNDEWGDRVLLNDTTGIVRLLIPDSMGIRGTKGRLEKADRLLGGKKTTDRVAFRDLVQRKNNGKLKPHEHSIHDQLALNSKKYRIAKELIDEGVGGYRTASAQRARPSFTERARAESRGEYPVRDDGGANYSEPTAWERDNGGRVRTGPPEHLVHGIAGPATKARWEAKLRAAGVLDTPHGDRFNLLEGDAVYATGKPGSATYGNAGVVVRAKTGEVVPWTLHPDKPLPADWGAVLNDATREGTWARFIDRDAPNGLNAVDVLGEHGYVPIVRGQVAPGGAADLEEVIYMVFDPDDWHGMGLNGRRWKDSREGHDAMKLKDPSVARAQTMGYVESLHPERVKRAAQGAEDAKLLNRQRDLDDLDKQIAAKQNELKSPKSSSKYRDLVRQRAALAADMPTQAAQARKIAVDAEVINPGNVTFIERSERGIESVKPYLDESIEGSLDSLPPGEIEKIYALEAEMRLTGSYVDNTGKLVDSANYRLKRLPKQATPYQGLVAESEAYRVMVQGRIAAEDGWRTTATSKMAQASDLMFGRVYAVELQQAQRQEVYNELLNKGASVGEVNKFLKALQHQWEGQPSLLGARAFRSSDKLTPGSINDLAKGKKPDSKLFGDGFQGEWVQDFDFGSMMQRAGSRTFRRLAKDHPAQDGRGNLGKLIEQFYGKQSAGRLTTPLAGARKFAWGAGVFYTAFRFMTDPRWYAMNAFESDILGMARWGSKVRGIGKGGKARGTGIRGHLKGEDPSVPRDAVVETLSARRKDTELLSIDEMLHANAGASGWMDQRNLYGYVAEAAKVENPALMRKAFQQAWDDGSPVIDDLIKRHGKNEAAWMDEIDDLLFSIDTKGARRTVLDNELAQQMINDPVNGHLYEAFVTNLWKQQRQAFKDITHTFHGNINRSNMERIANSPFLWWPLSYQLKTGKWLVDTMSKNFAGHTSELAGTAILGKLMENHRWQMENNDSYFNMFDEHPALWRGLSMMLPITPFDMGVFMARWTRYAGSWTGAYLGLWDQDPSYPQNLANLFTRSLSLGPIYSMDLVGEIIGEFEGVGNNGFPIREG